MQSDYVRVSTHVTVESEYVFLHLLCTAPAPSHSGTRTTDADQHLDLLLRKPLSYRSFYALFTCFFFLLAVVVALSIYSGVVTDKLGQFENGAKYAALERRLVEREDTLKKVERQLRDVEGVNEKLKERMRNSSLYYINFTESIGTGGDSWVKVAAAIVGYKLLPKSAFSFSWRKIGRPSLGEAS
ncbi:hypothetical protein MNV49_002639 [Pseudohyphozyma bogoriensis]|nr:hypothetical protein MNV49_002639 [Pseudohyphozyma bogoriensis]